MKKMTLTKTQSAIALSLLASGFAAYAGSDVPTKASNIGSIVNTRHNLTQSYLKPFGTDVIMDMVRNNYEEVCVYCHTPHGANTTIAAPLWNRTNKETTYLPYNSFSLINPPDSKTYKPGANSLTCLSCHDGTVAIDSVINMPTNDSCRSSYNGCALASQMTSVNYAFLSSWPSNLTGGNSHMSLGAPGSSDGCTMCHSNTSPTGSYFPAATNFDAFVIGTDLRNDHPVGIKYPSVGPGVDFNKYTGEYKNIAFFDENSDGGLSKNEIRMYNTGTGYAVECASCHDPHGVPSSRPDAKIGEFTKSFMRKDNNESKLCQTCHVK